MTQLEKVRRLDPDVRNAFTPAAATQLLASNTPVTDSDLDALLPDEGYETLAKPEAPEKNAAVTDADLDSILPDEGYEKKDAQPEG